MKQDLKCRAKLFGSLLLMSSSPLKVFKLIYDYSGVFSRAIRIG